MTGPIHMHNLFVEKCGPWKYDHYKAQGVNCRRQSSEMESDELQLFCNPVVLMAKNMWNHVRHKNESFDHKHD